MIHNFVSGSTHVTGCTIIFKLVIINKPEEIKLMDSVIESSENFIRYLGKKGFFYITWPSNFWDVKSHGFWRMKYKLKT